MRTFTDARDRSWDVKLDLQAAIRVDQARITHGEHTLVVSDPDKWVFPALMRSPTFQAALLYQLCKPLADEREITEEQFQTLLFEEVAASENEEHGTIPVLSLAITALVGELNDFFRTCPISSRRLLRAQNQLLKLIESAVATMDGPADSGSNQTNADCETPTTPSSDSALPPASTGAPPD